MMHKNFFLHIIAFFKYYVYHAILHVHNAILHVHNAILHVHNVFSHTKFFSKLGSLMWNKIDKIIAITITLAE